MKYPIGIQEFDKIRKEGYVYVDKTNLVYQLVDGGVYYFLSRPRRFGKSLLLSTLEAYFLGRKELFEGLDIYSKEKDWLCYPVLHMDLNTANYQEEGSLEKVLDNYLNQWEDLYGSSASEQTQALRFKGIVERASKKTGRNVVILVDEYDKPILQTLHDPQKQENYRNQLKAFYSVLKTQDRYIKFAMLTGVTKFGKVSVFSDLNNLKDISMDRRFATICGITEEEMTTYFKEGIQELALNTGDTVENTVNKLRDYYDGYHFRQDGEGVYNPYSVLNTLDKSEFNFYWFETGTPTFLVEMLKRHHYVLPDLTRERISSDVINSVDSTSTNPIPVIYQSGYLTIKGYDARFRKYLLGFPNKEVEEGFLNFLLPYYSSAGERSSFFVDEFVRDVEDGAPERFMRRLSAMLSDTDYKVVGNAELYFQNVMYLVFKIMGFYIQVERPTSDGRMDAVIQTDRYVYIVECKLDKSADEALRQIAANNYAAAFAMDSRHLYKIGINFSSQTRSVESYKIEG